MSKDIILFINAIRPATFEALRRHEVQTGQHFTPVVFVDKAIEKSIAGRNGQSNLPEEVTVVNADFSSPEQIRKALAPYMHRVYAVTTQFENCLLELKKVIPYFPYLPMPTESSLEWGGEKKLMRNMLSAYDESLVPRYTEVANGKVETVKKIEQGLNYPMIVKPSGLEGSLLVTQVNNRAELQKTITETFEAMQASYDEWVKRQKPAVLVEDFMVGKKYVVDTYVAEDGTCFHAPLITSTRGVEAGFDDFFEYSATLPPELNQAEICAAQDAAERAVKALGFRSVTADIELMHTKTGWKIIELTARMGGYCHDMYSNAYEINHIMNDILVRAGEKPKIPSKLKNYVAVFDIYAKREGTLRSVKGLGKVKKLSSFHSANEHIKVGEKVTFAKNGGDSVYYLVFKHPDKKQLKQDVAMMENLLELQVD